MFHVELNDVTIPACHVPSFVPEKADRGAPMNRECLQAEDIDGDNEYTIQ